LVFCGVLVMFIPNIFKRKEAVWDLGSNYNVLLNWCSHLTCIWLWLIHPCARIKTSNLLAEFGRMSLI
jgi:hypothetical protein